MKKILQAILILWVSLPLLMEAMTAITNLDSYKMYVGWYTNFIYRSNKYYYIAAGIEILLVFLIFIDIKRKLGLYIAFGIVTLWHVLKAIIIEPDRALGYFYLRFNFSKVEYFTIFGLYVAIGALLFYLSYYRNRKEIA